MVNKLLLTITILVATFVLASCAPGQCVDDGVCSLNEQVSGNCQDCKPDLTAEIRSAWYDQDRNTLGATFCVANYGGNADGDIDVSFWYASENGIQFDTLTRNIAFTSNKADGFADLTFDEEGLKINSDFWVESQGYETSCFFHQFYGVEDAPRYDIQMNVDSANAISEKDENNNAVWIRVQGVRSPFEGYLLEQPGALLEVTQKFLFTSTANEVPVTTYAIGYRTENGEQISVSVAENENNDVEVFRQTYAYQIEKSERLDGPAEIYKFEQTGSYPYVQYLWFSEDGRAVMLYSQADEITTQTVLREYQRLHEPAYDFSEFVVDVSNWEFEEGDYDSDFIEVAGGAGYYGIYQIEYGHENDDAFAEVYFVQGNADITGSDLVEWYYDFVQEEEGADVEKVQLEEGLVYRAQFNNAQSHFWSSNEYLILVGIDGATDRQIADFVNGFLEEYASDVVPNNPKPIDFGYVDDNTHWTYYWNNERYEINVISGTPQTQSAEIRIATNYNGVTYHDVTDGYRVNTQELSFDIIDVSVQDNVYANTSVYFSFTGRAGINETYYLSFNESDTYTHRNTVYTFRLANFDVDQNQIVLNVKVNGSTYGEWYTMKEGDIINLATASFETPDFFVTDIPSPDAAATVVWKPLN